MKINEVIEVARPVSQVWELFSNVPELARCLPGAELTEDKGDGVYAGKVSTKLGPMTANFEGEATVTSDAAARTGAVSGKGADRRGGSMGQVKMQYRVEPIEIGTRINVDAEVILSGAAAQFGRTGLIKEMSNRLIAEFVKCLDAKLAAANPHEAAAVAAPEVKGLSLFFSSLLSTVTGFFKGLLGRKPKD
ncbi:MAG: SRPBCC family protein [Acidimicrobiia bacterium]